MNEPASSEAAAQATPDPSHRHQGEDNPGNASPRRPRTTKGNPRYRKGRNLEYRVLKLLREAGCLYPTRTAGSHGAYDVIAPFPEATYLISCKAYKGTLAEAKRIQEASKHTEARWGLVSLEGGKLAVQCWRGGKPWKVNIPGLGGWRGNASNAGRDST